MLNINKCRHGNNQMNDQWITIKIKYYNFYGTKIPVRGGEWYLEKRGSRKILGGSWNLGSVFDKSLLVSKYRFYMVCFYFLWVSKLFTKESRLGFSN